MSSLQQRQQQYEEAMERELKRMKREEYAQVVRRIRQMGGIRPHKNGFGQLIELEEWRCLPRSVRTYSGFNGRKPQPADDVALTLSEEFPWIGVQNENDLFKYLRRRPK